MKIKEKRIYLDYAAATPIDKGVSSLMKKAEDSLWANPSSLHEEGEKAKDVLEKARKEIAYILHCRSEEVYFTSGGTESANIAIQGILKAHKNAHVICSSFEHPAVLETVKNSGAEISLIYPDERGIVNPKSIEKEIKENTVLVCLMHANNEIGTIQPVREVSRIIKDFRLRKCVEDDHLHISSPYLFVDACQSVLYEDVSIERLGTDILMIDGIKMYGPRGAGVLVIKHGVKIDPIIFGGGQEKGLRPGTENAISALGLSEALKIASSFRESESERLTELRDYAIDKILSQIPGSSINGDQENRLPNNVNICFKNIDSEFLVIKLDTLGFSISAASACNSLKLENSSYVISSIGKPECASSSLRFTFGRETKKSDVGKLVRTLKNILL
ncbi:MAG TPA: cysteine desulfurase family protein [Candidatus Paceibacterota bacterium]